MAIKLSTLLGSAFTGTTGPAGSIQIGTVTSNPGSTTVTNVGTEKAAILDINIAPGTFEWPTSGIPVSTGSGWTTSLTVPSGSLVGTSATQTLTNKTVNLTSNTLVTTLAQLNTAVSDADLVSLAGSETLTNKTLTNPSISNPSIIGSITFSNGSTQSVAGASTGKAIAMAIVFGG